MAYQIDNQSVNSRDDWRHTPPVAAPTSARREGFPGSGAAVAIQGELAGPTLVVEGFLQGATAGSLHDATLQASAWRRGEHTVHIHGVTYLRMVLIDLRLGRVEAFRPEGGTASRRCRCSFVWQSLEAGD